MMTTPSSVMTMLGLQPRSVVSVHTLLVTFCIFSLLLLRVVASADEDGADVGELAGPGFAELAAVAGLLDAAEGSRGSEAMSALMNNAPESMREPTSSACSSSADQTLAPRPYGVALASSYGFVVGGERDDRGCRSEGLLGHDGHVESHVHQHRGGVPGRSPGPEGRRRSRARAPASIEARDLLAAGPPPDQPGRAGQSSLTSVGSPDARQQQRRRTGGRTRRRSTCAR